MLRVAMRPVTSLRLGAPACRTHALVQPLRPAISLAQSIVTPMVPQDAERE
jgi:hypothetical protein